MTSIKLLALLLALIPALPAQQDRFGNPACSDPDQELADRSFFVLCHSASRKVPIWVGYELTPDQLQRRAVRPSHFRHDNELAAPGADGPPRSPMPSMSSPVPYFESENTAVIGANHVGVPSHTHKVILAVQADRLTMYAAIVPNTATVNLR